jgi:hypothetical protein
MLAVGDPTSPICTVSLGIGQIAAYEAAEQPTSGTVSSRECPLMTLVNCTLIARRPSANQAGHISSWHESCERYRPSLIAAALPFSAAVAVAVAVNRDQESTRRA